MPRTSKVTVPPARTSSRPGDPPPPRERLDKFRCTRCGKIYKQQRNNFSPSHSPIYMKNDGYLPVCGNCLDDLLEHYKSVLGDEAEAIRRICMKFDIYWNPDLYAMIPKANTSNSRIKSYLSKTNLLKYVDKTYDDTLDEERNVQIYAPVVYEKVNGGSPGDTEEVSPDVIAFWGAGFDDNYYRFVQGRYDVWTKDLPDDLPVSTEALYKQICDTEATIARDTIAGKDTDKSKATLVNLMGALNEKPVQKKQDEALDQAFEEMPFGVGIKMCENTRPIPKPDPELEDVDGIVRYVTIWFLGHLCKMLGIKNTYCKLYEDEMARLRVERQVSEDEDDEGAFNDIFGDSISGGDSS